MTQPLDAVMAYIATHYPKPEDLSNARLTKLVYLADWEAAQATGRPMTHTRWVFNHYGPWVPDVLEAARRDPAHFEVRHSRNGYGTSKTLIVATPAADELARTLSAEHQALLTEVIRRTHKMYFGQFIDYVYATYPVEATDRYETLDLVQLAIEHAQSPPPANDRRFAPALSPGAQHRAITDVDPLRVDSAGGGETEAQAHSELALFWPATLDAELQADFRHSVHKAIKAMLGRNVPLPALRQIGTELENPTVESVEVAYHQLDLPRDQGQSFDLTVVVDTEIEGFQAKWAAGQFHGGPAAIRDADWNEHYAWVSVAIVMAVHLNVTFDAANRAFDTELVSAELEDRAL